ncbi:MAG: beta-N-acetylglucosaminidase, partial [Maribacter sp.]|nr:beta-N-acetylglucosaminidase [Maribacter sp.]
MRFYSIIPFFFLYVLCANAQGNPLVVEDSLAQQNWVDAKYDAMTMDERLGQLFMVSVASDQTNASTDKIKTLIKEHHIGGVIFSTGGPVRQAKLTNSFQAVSKIPLMVGMDAEWGLA